MNTLPELLEVGIEKWDRTLSNRRKLESESMKMAKSLFENSKSTIHVSFVHCYDKMLLRFSKSLVKPTAHT